MDWNVKFVKPLTDYRIYVELEDGRKGIFDLKPYLDRGVLRELADVYYFSQVGISFGAVTWPHEQDIAPETLVAEMLPVESANVPDLAPDNARTYAGTESALADTQPSAHVSTLGG